jgi:DNA-binding transcriptional ArsR family regulator
VKLLAAGGERTVGELDAVVGVSQSAISHALSDLADAGLVERRRDGTWRYYDTTDAAERLVAVLGELQE